MEWDSIGRGNSLEQSGTQTVIYKLMVTQFTDSHMVKNKSKNKKTLFKFGTLKNNKQQLLFPISISHRPNHGYIPGLCTLTPKT